MMPSSVYLHDGEHQITVRFPTEADRERFKAHYRTIDALAVEFRHENERLCAALAECEQTREQLDSLTLWQGKEIERLQQRIAEAEARAEAMQGLLREAYDDVPTAEALGPDPDVDGWFCPRCDPDVEHRYLSPEAICHAPTCLISRIDAALSSTTPRTEPPATPSPDREQLGREVREEWLAWQRAKPNPKPENLRTWEELDEGAREIEMRMGERLYGIGYAAGFLAGRDAALATPVPRRVDVGGDVATMRELLREALANAPTDEEMDETAVNYAGTCAYCGVQLWHDPSHPYTKGSRDQPHKPDCWVVRTENALSAPAVGDER